MKNLTTYLLVLSTVSAAYLVICTWVLVRVRNRQLLNNTLETTTGTKTISYKRLYLEIKDFIDPYLQFVLVTIAVTMFTFITSLFLLASIKFLP